MPSIQFTDAGIRLIRDALAHGAVPQITYLAIGTGTNTPAAGDIQLGHEVYRKQISDVFNGSSTAESIVYSYIGPLEATGTIITEAGWFAGESASTTIGTGILVARGLYYYPHTISDSIQFGLDYNIAHT